MIQWLAFRVRMARVVTLNHLPHSEMLKEAEELIENMALKGASDKQIRSALREQGFDASEDNEEFLAIVLRVRTARNVNPRPAGTRTARIVGICAIAFGLYRGSILLMILGGILVFFPSWKDESIDH